MKQLSLFPEKEGTGENRIIKIFIADAFTMVRDGIRRILQNSSDVAIVGEAENDQEVLEKLNTVDCDLLLLDISISGGNGLSVLHRIKKMRPELPVLLLSIYPEGHHAVRAIRAGADGYLTKEKTKDELLEAIKKISSGKKYMSPSLAERLTFDLGRAPKNPVHKMLSDREFQVMSMIASGKAIAEIAEELSLSIHTISTYRARILEKMKMKNDAEIIYYAKKEGLTS